MAGYRISGQKKKSMAFLCKTNEIEGIKLKLKQPITVPQKNQVPGNQLSERGKRQLESTTKRNQRECEEMESQPCPWIGRINAVEMTVLPKESYGFNLVHLKNTHDILKTKMDKTLLKVIGHNTHPAQKI